MITTKQTANIFSPKRHRHNLAFREIETPNPQILDVGGYVEINSIAREYFDAVEYTSINIGSAWYKTFRSDYLYDGNNLPFDDETFDFIISVDTLEHISESNRERIIKEMIRVAKKRVIIVTPFRREGEPTDESYIIDICKQYDIEIPPSLAEHELYGLPLLSDLNNYVKNDFGKMKFATIRRDYWNIQISMLFNTIVLQNDSESVNKKLQVFQEELLSNQPNPISANDAYRCVLIYDKDSASQ